jgi:hypothetical protein
MNSNQRRLFFLCFLYFDTKSTCRQTVEAFYRDLTTNLQRDRGKNSDRKATFGGPFAIPFRILFRFRFRLFFLKPNFMTWSSLFDAAGRSSSTHDNLPTVSNTPPVALGTDASSDMAATLTATETGPHSTWKHRVSWLSALSALASSRLPGSSSAAKASDVDAARPLDRQPIDAHPLADAVMETPVPSRSLESPLVHEDTTATTDNSPRKPLSDAPNPAKATFDLLVTAAYRPKKSLLNRTLVMPEYAEDGRRCCGEDAFFATSTTRYATIGSHLICI